MTADVMRRHLFVPNFDHEGKRTGMPCLIPAIPLDEQKEIKLVDKYEDPVPFQRRVAQSWISDSSSVNGDQDKAQNEIIVRSALTIGFFNWLAEELCKARNQVEELSGEGMNPALKDFHREYLGLSASADDDARDFPF